MFTYMIGIYIEEFIRSGSSCTCQLTNNASKKNAVTLNILASNKTDI